MVARGGCASVALVAPQTDRSGPQLRLFPISFLSRQHHTAVVKSAVRGMPGSIADHRQPAARVPPPANRRVASASGSRGAAEAFTSQPLLFARPEDSKPSGPKPPAWMHKQDTNTQAIGHHTKAVKLLHVSKDLDGALKALNRAIELAPRAPGLRMDRGLVYRKLGRWSDAIQDYADARSLEEKLAQQAMVEKSFRQSPNRMARRPTTSAGLGGGGRGGVAASSLAERMEARIKGTSPEPADGGRASESESNSVLEAAAATDADEPEARARSGKAARGVGEGGCRVGGGRRGKRCGRGAR